MAMISYQKCDFVLSYTLEPNAYSYLNYIRDIEPATYRTMFKYLMQPKDIRNVDAYIATIRKNGRGPRNRVNIITVIKIYRKVKGIKNKIEVERDGKREGLFGRKVA